MIDNPNRPLAMVLVPERETSMLTLPNGDEREFFVRGAVCWPVLRPGGSAVEGCVLVAAQDVETRRVYVFEESVFHRVEALRDPDTNRTIDLGAVPAFSVGWMAYGCRRYFFNQIDEFNDVCMGLVRESKTILPKPSMIRVDWSSEEEAAARLLQWAPKMVMPEGGVLQQQHHEFMATPAPRLIHFPAMQALACLQTGLERWPWRKSGVPRRFGP